MTAPASDGPFTGRAPAGARGMGAVYLAVRDDDQFHKEVAIKPLRLRAERVRRGAIPARAADPGSPEHPHIARLDGAPPARKALHCAEYVAESRLQPGARNSISPSSSVCALPPGLRCRPLPAPALVVHRHQAGQHPGDPEGAPKLLDFGIASSPYERANGPGPAPGYRRLLMTPDYASLTRYPGGEPEPDRHRRFAEPCSPLAHRSAAVLVAPSRVVRQTASPLPERAGQPAPAR